jgi:AAA family ATP:ADP antiporter
MAELWGSVVVSVLFWGFANQITTVDEAERFYPLFGLGANVALIFSGQAVKYFSQVGSSSAQYALRQARLQRMRMQLQRAGE